MADYGPYGGPAEERIPGALMHCKTTLPNSECPQLRAGCLGCTFATSSVFVSGVMRIPLVLSAAEVRVFAERLQEHLRQQRGRRLLILSDPMLINEVVE